MMRAARFASRLALSIDPSIERAATKMLRSSPRCRLSEFARADLLLVTDQPSAASISSCERVC